VPFASHDALYIALFVSVFVTFVPAIMAHPAGTRAGTRYRLDMRALRVAEPWTIVLALTMVLALCVIGLMLSPSADHYRLDTASLIGRRDRQLSLSFFFGTFHACSVTIASSGLRWGLVPASSTSASWFGRLLSPPLVHGATLGPPGAPFSYRTSTVTWSFIALEVVGIIVAVVFAGNELRQALRLPNANILPLVLLVVPLWHSLLECCGSIAFRVQGNCLLTRHFPFRSRNRRIPVADIRGIQVNSELDDEGRVRHYSLLLIRDHASTDRLVESLPSAEQARVLAQQIDSLIRLETRAGKPDEQDQ